MAHPVEWTHADVQTWCIAKCLPPAAVSCTAALDGLGLWLLTEESLHVPADEEGECQDDTKFAAFGTLLDAVAMLRKEYEAEDALLALRMMEDDNPALAAALEAEMHERMRDHFYSLQVLQLDIQRLQMCEADSELATRLRQEARLDAFSLRVAQEQEQQRLDHELASQIQNIADHEADHIIATHGRDVVTAPPLNDPVPKEYDDDCAATAALDQHDIGSSPAQEEAQPYCIACMTAHHDTKLLPCGHYMCTTCLKHLFQTALKDNSLIPVTCCQKELPISLMQLVLNKDELFLLCERKREKAIVNKMYCPNPVCSYLMDLDQLLRFSSSKSSVIACVSCAQALCICCKSFAHDGECNRDGSDPNGESQLVELAAFEGWKRCKRCYTFVSLKHGCNHITCVCRYEFCYICEEEWTHPKSCPCPLWVDENLIQEEDRLVDDQEDQLGRQLNQVSSCSCSLGSPWSKEL